MQKLFFFKCWVHSFFFLEVPFFEEEKEGEDLAEEREDLAEEDDDFAEEREDVEEDAEEEVEEAGVGFLNPFLLVKKGRMNHTPVQS